MSIIYNNQVVAGKYKEQIINEADTINSGVVKIATQEEVEQGESNTSVVTPYYLAQKQDKISAGDGIVIDNNEISCTIKPDEQTMVLKNNGTMQCIGQLTKSNTLKFDWEGTQAEYNVAYLNGIIQPDWYCYITDDEQFVDLYKIKDEVVESGNTALSNIETAKSNALNDINTTGAEYVNNAEQYAQNALNSANNAALSESNALSYKNSAQENSQTATEQASIATTNANKAITSATNAKTSETNAKTSETNAKSSETRCEEILSRLGTAIKIKGRVDSLDDLPLSGNLDGDAYLVGQEGLNSYPEYYWYQDHWEFLGTSETSLSWGLITGNISAQTDLQTALNGKLSTTGTADKALKDSNGLQINTTYMRKTIGDTGIPATPTAPTALAMVGRQGCGNGNIAGGNLVVLHKNTLFRCYERGSTITCNYEDKVANLGKTMCDGSFSGHYTQINPSTSFTSKPFVWQVTSPTQYEISDVCRLHIYSHRLIDALNVTAFKIEAYIQDTLTNSKKWVTAYEYSGASKNIAQTGFGLYKTGYSSNPYYAIFGIRLTISGSPDTVFRMSQVQLVASRGTETLADSLQCVSNAGGKIWGNLEITGTLKSSNTYTKTEVNNITDTKVDLDGGNYLGSGLETIIKNNSGSGFNLFDTKISDHVLDGESAKGWALQGSYVNGAVYPDFYAKCIEEYNQATATETINGVTVKVHSNGHKFYNISDKTAIDEFFNTMGSAWFYGVDTENERIFLPRNNYFEQVTSSAVDVGQSVEAGLPNITGEFGAVRWGSSIGNGAFTNTGSGTAPISGGGGLQNTYGLYSLDASRSNAIYGNSDTVQPNAVKKLLYICVGNTIVNEDQIDVSQVLSEAVLRSSLEEVQTVIETYKNGTSWYRIWSDGWCEQGGKVSGAGFSSAVVVTFLKAFADTNYSVTVTNASNQTSYIEVVCGITSNAKMNVYGYSGHSIYWRACGYIW